MKSVAPMEAMVIATLALSQVTMAMEPKPATAGGLRELQSLRERWSIEDMVLTRDGSVYTFSVNHGIGDELSAPEFLLYAKRSALENEDAVEACHSQGGEFWFGPTEIGIRNGLETTAIELAPNTIRSSWSFQIAFGTIGNQAVVDPNWMGTTAVSDQIVAPQYEEITDISENQTVAQPDWMLANGSPNLPFPQSNETWSSTVLFNTSGAPPNATLPSMMPFNASAPDQTSTSPTSTITPGGDPEGGPNSVGQGLGPVPTVNPVYKDGTVIFCALFGLRNDEHFVNQRELAIKINIALDGTFSGPNYGVTAALCEDAGLANYEVVRAGQVVPFCICSDDYPSSRVESIKELRFQVSPGESLASVVDGRLSDETIDRGCSMTTSGKQCCRVDTLLPTPQRNLELISVSGSVLLDVVDSERRRRALNTLSSDEDVELEERAFRAEFALTVYSDSVQVPALATASGAAMPGLLFGIVAGSVAFLSAMI